MKTIYYISLFILLFIIKSYALAPSFNDFEFSRYMPWTELVEDESQLVPSSLNSKEGKYWLNNYEMRLFFQEYLESNTFLDGTLQIFKESLKEAHRIAASGKKGTRTYKRGRIEPFVTGGRFREFNGSENYKYQFLIQVQVANDLNEKYQLNDPYPLIIDDFFEGIITIKLKSVPSKSWPFNQYIDQPNFEQTIGYIYHPHPDWNLFSDFYFRVMYNSLKEAVNNLQNKYLVIRNLAIFFQYGINLSPFPEINKSFLMNIVNLVLNKAHLKGITHKFIDFAAYSFQQETFFYYFLDEVKLVNPNLNIFYDYIANKTENAA